MDISAIGMMNSAPPFLFLVQFWGQAERERGIEREREIERTVAKNQQSIVFGTFWQKKKCDRRVWSPLHPIVVHFSCNFLLLFYRIFMFSCVLCIACFTPTPKMPFQLFRMWIVNWSYSFQLAQHVDVKPVDHCSLSLTLNLKLSIRCM